MPHLSLEEGLEVSWDGLLRGQGKLEAGVAASWGGKVQYEFAVEQVS